MVEIFQGHPIFQRILEKGSWSLVGNQDFSNRGTVRLVGSTWAPRTREENLLGVFSRDSLGVFFLGKKRRNSFGVTGCTWHRSNRIQLWEDTLLVHLREPERRVSWGFLGGTRERQPFFPSAFQPSWRPVLARTRFENSGLFKGNYRFYFRSARQFEFLIGRKELRYLGIAPFDFRRGEDAILIIWRWN